VERPGSIDALGARVESGGLDAAAAPARLFRHERGCMGTACTISVFHGDEALVSRAAGAAFAEMERLEALMSHYREDSDLGRLNAAAGVAAVPVAPETLEVIEKALWVARETRGAFDITVGAFAGLWRFDEDKDGSIPTRREVLARKRLVDYRDVLVDRAAGKVRLRRRGQKVNLGGIAKGYIVDAAVAKLRAHGLRDFLVQAGGDLYAAGRRGSRDWIVGIQDPRAPPELPKSGATTFAVLPISDKAFNTSGDYERFVIKDGRRYHHILDPRTGYPVAHTRGVTILASSAFLADAVDTAILVLGAREGMAFIERLAGVEGVIVDGRNEVHVSSGLSGRLERVRAPTDGL
jgi:FAD:protein FMN transferase